MATNSSGEFTFEDSSPDSLDEFQRSLIEDLKACKFNSHTDTYVHTVRPFQLESFAKGVWNSN